MSVNQRKFPRANYPCTLTIWQGHSYNTILANTANIGAGGFLVYLNQNLMVGAKVEVRINFSKQDIFECNGIVVRCQESLNGSQEPARYFAVAIAFEGLQQEQVARIREIIDQLLEENRE